MKTMARPTVSKTPRRGTLGGKGQGHQPGDDGDGGGGDGGGGGAARRL